jgi:hypothetical protein
MHCTDCETCLDEVSAGDPCPWCGGVSRSANACPDPATARGEAHIPPTTADSHFPNGSEETSVRDDHGHWVSRRNYLGQSSQEFGGSPIQGEDGVLQVCWVLQMALEQKEGLSFEGGFSVPPGPEEGVDAQALMADGSPFRVQVVGVIAEATQRSLRQQGHTSARKTADALAGEVCSALQKKTKSYPIAQKRKLVLALDATKSPGHAHKSVAQALKRNEQHLSVATCSEFQAVWLVGSTVDRTFRLDQSGKLTASGALQHGPPRPLA